MIEINGRKINTYIGCMSSDLPGASYQLNVGKSNGKIVCGNRGENEYVEIPIELLEKIAGKSLDL